MTEVSVSARNRKNKRDGADWEIALETNLRAEGFDVERLRTKGKNDEGDLVIREADGTRLIIEAKNAAFQPGTFIAEAETERANYAKHHNVPADQVDSIVVVKRRGQNWRKAFVLTTLEDYLGLDLET